MPSGSARIPTLGRQVARGGRLPHALRRRVRLRTAAFRHHRKKRQTDVETLQDLLASPWSVSNLVASFVGHGTQRFFFGPDQGRANVEHLEACVPGWREATLSDAARLLERKVRLLGADEIFVGETNDGQPGPLIRWHEDFDRLYKWDPAAYYKLVPIPYGRAEAKIPWELSRCQHLPTLGFAYLATGDECFAHEAVAQITDWIACNPPGCGINWACSMDIAIRAVNWLWAWHLIASSESCSSEFTTRLLASLGLHARHISTNLEVYDRGLTTNHTVADYAGLAYIGILLPEFHEAPAWREQAVVGLRSCMDTQIHDDGGAFENSTAYHRLVLELFLSPFLLARHNGLDFGPRYANSLEAMCEFVCSYTRPDGLAPLLGDSDDGRLHILSQYFRWHPQDHRYLLAVAGRVFARADFSAASDQAPGAEDEVTWLLGPAAPGRPGGSGAFAPPRSRAFPNCGRYIMRNGADYVCVNTDEVGTGGLGNHKHNDILAFELCVGGKPLLVDGGSYVYISDAAARDAFRATRAHNTLCIDNAEQNEMVGPFQMAPSTRVLLNAWRSTPSHDLLDVAHTGYERLTSPVRHRRRFVFAKDPFALLVLDEIEGSGSHQLDGFLHFSPEGRVRIRDIHGGSELRRLAALARLAGLSLPGLSSATTSVEYVGRDRRVVTVLVGWPRVDIGDGWVAPRWGQRQRAPIVHMSGALRQHEPTAYLIYLDETEEG